EGVEALRAIGLHLGDDVGGPVAADPAVGLDPVAHQAAEQLVDRHAQGLALNVPQRLVDAGDRAHQDRAAAVEAAAVEHLPQVVDARRVATDQVVAQLAHGRLDGVRAALDHRLAPAADAFVGVDAQEQPAWRGVPRAQACDLHPWWSIHALRKRRACSRVRSTGCPARYSSPPMPAPWQPAASQAGSVSGVTPPTANSGTGGSTARSARTVSGP